MKKAKDERFTIVKEMHDSVRIVWDDGTENTISNADLKKLLDWEAQNGVTTPYKNVLRRTVGTMSVRDMWQFWHGNKSVHGAITGNIGLFTMEEAERKLSENPSYFWFDNGKVRFVEYFVEHIYADGRKTYTFNDWCGVPCSFIYDNGMAYISAMLEENGKVHEVDYAPEKPFKSKKEALNYLINEVKEWAGKGFESEIFVLERDGRGQWSMI